MTLLQAVLAKCGLAALSSNVTYMLHPNHSSRGSGNRHYLYINGQWTTSGVTMTGTMDAAGTVTGGTFSFSVPTGTVDQLHVAWNNAGTTTVVFSIGFNRALTAAERSALSASSFFASLVSGTAVTSSQCGAIYPVDYQSLSALWDNVQGANAQRVYNKAYLGPRTNLAENSDIVSWAGDGTKTSNQIAFLADATDFAYHYIGVVDGYTAIASDYTITCEAKVASGTGTFRLGVARYGSATYLSNDLNLTDAWQTFTFSKACTAGWRIYPIIQNGSGGSAVTIQIRNIRFNEGSSDLGAEPAPYYDGWLGKTNATEASFDPAYSSEGIDYGAGANKGVYIFGTNPSLTSWTIYSLFKWTGTPATADVAILAGIPYVGQVFASVSNAAPFPGVVHTTTTRCAGVKKLNDSQPHILTVAYNSSTQVLTFYVDGLMRYFKNVGGARTVSFSALGGLAVCGFPGTIGAQALYSVCHTSSQVTQNVAAINSYFGNTRNMVVSPSYASFMCVDGDSFAEANSGVEYTSKAPYISAAAMTPYLEHSNFALSGQRIDQRNSAAATGVDLLAPYGTKSVIVLWCGYNDMAAAANAATIYGRYQTYCLARKAAGWDRVVLINMLPCSNSSYNTVRNSVNALLASDHSFCDQLVDVAADATIGPDAAGSDVTYYGDGIHPTATTHGIVAGYLTTALTASLA